MHDASSNLSKHIIIACTSPVLEIMDAHIRICSLLGLKSEKQGALWPNPKSNTTDSKFDITIHHDYWSCNILYILFDDHGPPS